MTGNNDFQEPFRPQMPRVEIPRFTPPPPRLVLKLLGAFLAVAILLSGFYTIDPEEAGLVLRFGKFSRISEPGLHFKLPLGIESVMKVPIQRQLKEEFGFRTIRADINTQYSSRNFLEESSMLTGDLNSALVEWVVQYRIVDPYKYLFQVRNVKATFRDMTEAVTRRVVGDRTVNEVLTVGRAEVATQIQVELQEMCIQYDTGISVDQVVLQDINPPDLVKPSFNAVNEAQQEKEKLINQAQSEYNREIPRASGQAMQTIEEAEGYALNRVNRAEGDATAFNALYDEYRKAPDVTRRRMYLETMAQVLPQVRSKVIVDDDLRGVLPLLNLDGRSAGRGGK
jgi:membrane protease subunit HflK